MGKTVKSYATSPGIYPFSLGKRGEACSLFFKNFKIFKRASLLVVFPYAQQHTCFDAPSVPVVHYKIVHCFALNTCIFPISLQILSFSSNRKAQNSAPSFQFMTPGNKFIQKSMKSTKFQHFQLQKETKFRPIRFICDSEPLIWQNHSRMTQISSLFSTYT